MAMKKVYNVIEIEDNHIESADAYSTKKKAEAGFRKKIKERYPWMESKEIEDYINAGLVPEKGYTLNLIYQNI